MATAKRLFFNRKHGLVAVKTGFSWPAFFFGGLWAAVKGMWYPHFLAMLPIDIALWFATGFAEAQGNDPLALVGAVATLAYAFGRGKFGNRWLVSSLLRRGFVEETRREQAAA